MLRISIQELLKLKLASSVLVAVLDFHDYSPKLFEKESPSRKEDAADESLTWGFERALHVQLRLPFWLPLTFPAPVPAPLDWPSLLGNWLRVVHLPLPLITEFSLSPCANPAHVLRLRSKSHKFYKERK